MTFEEYMNNGGDREEKLVVIYKTHPDKLSSGYKGIFEALDSNNINIVKPTKNAFPSLEQALYKWNSGTIPEELEKQGADFVDEL